MSPPAETDQYWAGSLRAGDVLHVGSLLMTLQGVSVSSDRGSVTVFGLLDERPCTWVLESDDIVTFDREVEDDRAALTFAQRLDAAVDGAGFAGVLADLFGALDKVRDDISRDRSQQ